MTKYRVKIKPYRYELYTKKKIDALIKSGELTDWNRIEFVPQIHMGIRIFDPSKKSINEYGIPIDFWHYETCGLGWRFDKIQKRLIKKIMSPDFLAKIIDFKCVLYFAYYSSFHQPSITVDCELRKILNLLNAEIYVDGYVIYKTSYKYSTYPWHKKP